MKIETEQPKKPTYIYGNILGNLMSKVDMRTQLEASLLSMTFMFIGLIITTFYIAFYVTFPLWYKIILIINLIAGLVFFSSNIIQLFQQYQNYMEVVLFQKEQDNFNKEINEEIINKKTNLKGGY